MVKKANVLGTIYKIEVHKEKDDEVLQSRGLSGYCDSLLKLIVVTDLDSLRGFEDYNEKDKDNYRKQVLRHELTHAFLNESGLEDSSLQYSGAWAKNEEMVDWFAIQFPKILKLFEQCDCI